jgi:transcriptional regulator with XRE-family HTH domain
MSGGDGTNRLGDYLRARRELVTPEQAGIHPGARRKVKGLRREEVALLAGISADYYLRLERGCDKNPSPQVLEALARVLRLDDVEGRYLIELTAPRPRARPRRRPEHVPARLHHLLAAVGVPAFVEGRSFDVLAATPWPRRCHRDCARAGTGCVRCCSTRRNASSTPTGNAPRPVSSRLSARPSATQPRIARRRWRASRRTPV